MFAVLWFLFVAFGLAFTLVWLLDHNGEVLITWLGYQLQTDILTAILLAVFLSLAIFVVAYLAARILAIRFPTLLKFFFTRSYIKKLEKLIQRHHYGFDAMLKLSLALEAHDEKSARDLQKNFSKLIKYLPLNNFFLGKIAFDEREFSRAIEYFMKLGDNKHAKILMVKAKLHLALEAHDDVKAIAYAKQILAVRRDNFFVAQTLFALYKKRGLWQDAKSMIAQYGSDKFKDELQKRDLATINSALAFEAYQQKKFLLAIKHAKIALKAENNFLPALEVMLKSWIKLGLAFKARWKIKVLWRENPHLILAEIFDLTYRKSSAKNRIKMMKQLAATNSESPLGKIALGLVAFRVSSYQLAKEYLNSAILREKNYRSYKLLAAVGKVLGDDKEYRKNLAKAHMLEHDDHYICNSCGHLSSRWSARCLACDAYDSLEWSN